MSASFDNSTVLGARPDCCTSCRDIAIESHLQSTDVFVVKLLSALENYLNNACPHLLPIAKCLLKCLSSLVLDVGEASDVCESFL
jgi:hypothetical protein